MLAFFVLGFYAFLRFNDFINIRVGDITFFDDYFSVFLSKAKNDQEHRGNCVRVAKNPSKKFCPFLALHAYLRAAHLLGQSEPDILIFRQVARNGKRLVGHKPLCYSRVRDMFHTALCTVGIGEESLGNFGLHSLRSGGTSGAHERGVSRDLIQRHGRWLSAESMEGYIKDSLLAELSVSKSLFSNST